MSIALLLSLVSCLAYLTDFGIFIVLHFLPTGYHPVQHAVSDYAIGEYHRLFRIYLWSSAFGTLALASALAAALGSPLVPSWVLGFLVVLAFTCVAVSLFPTDIEGKPLTRTGILHYSFVVLSFAFMYTVPLNLTPTLTTIFPWQQMQALLAFLATIALPALIAVVVTMWRPLRVIFGLCERLFLITTNVWFILVSASLVVKTI